VAKDNEALFENNDFVPDFTLNSIHINDKFLGSSSFRVTPRTGQAGWVQCMEMCRPT
jgi:hypothetical protein